VSEKVKAEVSVCLCSLGGHDKKVKKRQKMNRAKPASWENRCGLHLFTFFVAF
jgi:hypothetical protein